MGPNGEIPQGSRPRVFLSDSASFFRNKDALKDLHSRVRKEQGELSIQRLSDIPLSKGMPECSSFGRKDLPLTLESTLLQALCYLIYEMKEATFVGLEVRYSLPSLEKLITAAINKQVGKKNWDVK